MPLRARTLSVVPNPWIHIDHQGRPAGAVPHDLPPGHKGFVGARVDSQRTKVLHKAKKGELRDSVQDTAWNISTEAVNVPNTPYYLKRVRSGELLAADEQTARLAGLREFVAPDKALAAAREKAIAEFDAMHGKGTFAQLADERRKAAEAAEATAAPPQAPAPAPNAAPSGKKGDD